MSIVDDYRAQLRETERRETLAFFERVSDGLPEVRALFVAAGLLPGDR
jgi:hypothetical protein